MTGVIEKERERRQGWEALDLPDPVQVLSEERVTERETGEPFTSPKRALLTEYLEAHPDKRPNGW